MGIIGAMPEEMEKILSAIPQPVIEEYGKRKYYSGKWGNLDVVGVFSRWGKVASAATVTELIVRYKVDKVVFVGIAGAVSPDLNVGDVVVASGFYQHDMDARPLMPRFELPLTGNKEYTRLRKDFKLSALFWKIRHLSVNNWKSKA